VQLPDNIDGRIDSLAEATNSVQVLVDTTLSAFDPPEAGQTVGDVRRAAAELTAYWLETAGGVFEAFEDHRAASPDDDAEVAAREGALMLLHVDLASDLALLQPLDDFPDDEPMSRAVNALPARPFTLKDAFSDRSDNLHNVLRGRTPRQLPFDPNITVDDVVRSIVETSGRSLASTVRALAGGHLGPVMAGLDHLFTAMNLPVEQALRALQGAIAKMVTQVLFRARDLLPRILRVAVDDILAAAKWILPRPDITENLTDRAARIILQSLFQPSVIVDRANAHLDQALDNRDARLRRIQDLPRTNREWVGPVRYVSAGLPVLWALPLPHFSVPLALIAGTVLIGWTVLTSADQLDVDGYPNVWKGVVRCAAGEV